MRREISIRTPENIRFTYPLAGLATRAVAVLLDLAFLGFGTGLVLGGAYGITQLAGAGGLPFVGSAAMGLALGFTLALILGYFTLFETLWTGQTPGKRITGIRVIREGGLSLRFQDALLRNLLRMADLLPGLGLVGGVVALFSTANRRLGDLAAGTVVVRVQPVSLPTTIQYTRSRFNTLREDPALAARVRRSVSQEEAALARDILQRSPGGTARVQAARQLAATLRQRLRLHALTFLSDEALLRDILEVLEYGDVTTDDSERWRAHAE
jgi:uncharacterized RDD family membrane protein YckC